MLTDKAEIAEALVRIYIYIYQDSLKTNSTYKFYYTLEEVMVFGNQPAGQKSCLVCNLYSLGRDRREQFKS